MKHERATEELREITALYVLGSLTQQEARSFENHLKEGCSTCETERRRFERAVAAIGLSTAEAAPPEYIRDLLSARIEREPQPTSPAVSSIPMIEEKPAAEPPRPKPPSFSIMSQPQSERPKVLPWIFVVVLALLGLLAANAWRTAHEANAELQARVSASRADADDLKTQLETHKSKSGNLEQILGIAGKPGARIARLVVQTPSPTTSATIIWDTEKNKCLILGSFPPAPSGKSYQLWFFTPMARVPTGSFQPDTSNQVFAAVSVPAEAAAASVAVVTVEPDNGSQIPTSPYFAIGRIN